MLEWNEYVEQILTRESSFDGVKLSIGDTHESIGVPPMIKASILMLDRMMECQGKNNILVFPERIQSIFIFTLVKLLYNISEGRIERAYDPTAFQPGEKLRFGKAVVEFVGFEEVNGKKRMKIRLAENLTIQADIDFFPLFQHTNTSKKLSNNKQYVEAKREAEKLLPSLTDDEKYLKLLADYKTHMDSSIVNMTSIINTKAMISDCKLCGRSVKDAILVGQADYEGTVKNIGAGQLGGTPAIVLASDLYSIYAMAQKKHPIQSIIIDASNTNAMLSQMDALDDLMRLGVPITCVTDIANSFDLKQFTDRGFNVWRWDQTSITDKLYDANPLISDLKTKHCATKKVEYMVSDGKEISTAIKKISMHKRDTQTFSAQMLKVFDKLYSVSVSSLQETVPYDEGQLTQARTVLEECDGILQAEKNYLAPKVYEDFKDIVASLKRVFAKGYLLPKNDALKERLQRDYSGETLCIVVPEKSDKKRVEIYWQKWFNQQQRGGSVSVLYPAEFCSNQHLQFSRVFVVGWLKRAIMRKVLYSFNANDYVILLYDYEKRWKNYDTARWNRSLDSAHNKQTIEKSFATEKLHISTSRFEPKRQETEPPPKDDEFTELEAVIRENKYRQYVAGGGKKAADETVEAIPINYVGNYLAFYRTGHKVISASNIIINDDDKIDLVLPDQLKLGDFVVVRETDHDLIKELADRILERSGKTGARELATKWKEALEIEQLFSTEEDIYQRLLGVGFTKGFPTVHRWLSDDDVIAPQSKQDLKYIATITGSAVLKEMLEQIFDAAQTVRSAHVQAGRVLSEKLRSRIVESLNEYGDIDPFNIWEPIEMQIEGIGMVRILKIIDIGAPVIVDITDTNRLIEE